MNNDINHYRSRGARALVLMHEAEMREFAEVWREAYVKHIPTKGYGESDEAAYKYILFHVFAASRGYIRWICEKLGLPDPEINKPPAEGDEELITGLDSYLDHLLERWRLPLADLPEERMEEEFKSRWGMTYAVDAMLEHAVMHPKRHAFQIREWGK